MGIVETEKDPWVGDMAAPGMEGAGIAVGATEGEGGGWAVDEDDPEGLAPAKFMYKRIHRRAAKSTPEQK